MKIEDIHALWHEKQGFKLNVQGTEPYYVFIHFLSKVYTKNGEIKKGGCIWYKPHSYREFSSPDCELVHDWLHISGDIKAITDRYGLELGRVYYPNEHHKITEVMQAIETEQLNRRMYWEELSSLKIKELCANISRYANEETAGKVDRDTYERFLDIRRTIQAEFYRIDNVEGFSENAGLSPSRFYTLYRRIFGISPKQDLLNIRMSHAKRMLLQGSGSVCSIAEALGYNSQYHFIRQFKEFTGTTPARYARSMSGSNGTVIVR